MDRELKLYIENVQADIQALVYSDGEGATFEDKFTEYCIETLETIGETEDARVCFYNYPGESGKDWKVNGFCLRDSSIENKTTYYETLDLFITYYQNEFYYNITKDTFSKSINQIKRFLNGALKGHIDYVDPSHEVYSLINIIYKQGKNLDRINIFFLMNGTSTHNIEKISLKSFEDLGIYVHVWDIERLFRLSQTNIGREPLEINFQELLNETAPGISCLKIPDLHEFYECYLAIIPGSVLSKLYKEYSSKLLESNVRAFLGQAGKYNKGIRDTIRGKPHMFLPYNNGISATAELVETINKDNQLYITKLNDFQIVNGGQTTASIYHTEKKYRDADLSKIFVQMKLTVIKDQEKKSIEVPNIARYANSQNKVSELDLSSNNPFFIRIEELSRRKYVTNLENKSQHILWFFERVSGQYREALNKLTPAQQRMFKEKNPTSLKFAKSDVAKYINLWELEPNQVSFGSQKNFIHYMKKVSSLVAKGKLPGDNFYKKLIGSAIFYNTVDKLFGRKNIDAIGDTNLKSFTVAYTVSYFHYLTQNRLDLWKIYEEQRIDGAIIQLTKDLLIYVYDHLVKGANNSLISEHAKKESTWQSLIKSNYKLNINFISDYIISSQIVEERESEKEIDNSDMENELVTLSKITSLGLKFWNGLKSHIQNSGIFKDIEFEIWDLIKILESQKNFDKKGIRTGKRVVEEIEKGNLDVDYIKSISSLTDDKAVDLKVVFDRMKMLSQEDWGKILALGSQINIFDNLELANIKSVQRSILYNENIKSNSLIKAHESLLKLKKFGIKY